MLIIEWWEEETTKNLEIRKSVVKWVEKERNQGGRNNKNIKKRKKVLLEGWKKSEVKEEETTKILRKGKKCC